MGLYEDLTTAGSTASQAHSWQATSLTDEYGDDNATLVGSPASGGSLGVAPDSWDFNGTDQAVAIADAVTLGTPSMDFTGAASGFAWELWYEADALSGNQCLVEAGGSTNGQSIGLQGSTLGFTVRHNNSHNAVTATVASGVRHVVAVAYHTGLATNGHIALYVDGALADSASGISYSRSNSGGSLGGIGYGNSYTRADESAAGLEDYFAGRISGVRMWHFSASDSSDVFGLTEAQALFAGPSTGSAFPALLAQVA